MGRKMQLFAVIGGALVAGAGSMRAQGPVPEGMPPIHSMQVEGPVGLTGALGFEGLPGGKVVKGAPFSALAVSESTQTLPDGNHIHHTTQTALYRDSEGRLRRDVTLPAIGPLTASQIHTFTSIYDPVSGTNYVLEPETKTARKLPAPPAESKRAARHQIDLKLEAERQRGSESFETESLPTQTINGVNAQGTRSTRTIPAGQIGNEKPITLVYEQWYSPDLQAVVMSKRSDPRFGETTYTLKNIQRQEPDASLFQVPADYTVKEAAVGMKLNELHSEAPPVTPRP